jgi:hypothetical protein
MHNQEHPADMDEGGHGVAYDRKYGAPSRIRYDSEHTYARLEVENNRARLEVENNRARLEGARSEHVAAALLNRYEKRGGRCALCGLPMTIDVIEPSPGEICGDWQVSALLPPTHIIPRSPNAPNQESEHPDVAHALCASGMRLAQAQGDLVVNRDGGVVLSSGGIIPNSPSLAALSSRGGSGALEASTSTPSSEEAEAWANALLERAVPAGCAHGRAPRSADECRVWTALEVYGALYEEFGELIKQINSPPIAINMGYRPEPGADGEIVLWKRCHATLCCGRWSRVSALRPRRPIRPGQLDSSDYYDCFCSRRTLIPLVRPHIILPAPPAVTTSAFIDENESCLPPRSAGSAPPVHSSDGPALVSAAARAIALASASLAISRAAAACRGRGATTAKRTVRGHERVNQPRVGGTVAGTGSSTSCEEQAPLRDGPPMSVAVAAWAFTAAAWNKPEKTAMSAAARQSVAALYGAEASEAWARAARLRIATDTYERHRRLMYLHAACDSRVIFPAQPPNPDPQLHQQHEPAVPTVARAGGSFHGTTQMPHPRLSLEGHATQMPHPRLSMEGHATQMPHARLSLEGHATQMPHARLSLEGHATQMPHARLSMEGHGPPMIDDDLKLQPLPPNSPALGTGEDFDSRSPAVAAGAGARTGDGTERSRAMAAGAGTKDGIECSRAVAAGAGTGDGAAKGGSIEGEEAAAEAARSEGLRLVGPGGAIWSRTLTGTAHEWQWARQAGACSACGEEMYGVEACQWDILDGEWVWVHGRCNTSPWAKHMPHRVSRPDLLYAQQHAARARADRAFDALLAALLDPRAAPSSSSTHPPPETSRPHGANSEASSAAIQISDTLVTHVKVNQHAAVESALGGGLGGQLEGEWVGGEVMRCLRERLGARAEQAVVQMRHCSDGAAQERLRSALACLDEIDPELANDARDRASAGDGSTNTKQRPPSGSAKRPFRPFFKRRRLG